MDDKLLEISRKNYVISSIRWVHLNYVNRHFFINQSKEMDG